MEKRDILFKESVIAKDNRGFQALYQGHMRFEEILYMKVGLKVSFLDPFVNPFFQAKEA
jgi:hypothetical protein